MNSWWIVGAIGLAIVAAIYLGLNTAPAAGTVSAQVPSTSAIDTNNAMTQAELSALSTQSQILTQLHLHPVSISNG